MSKPGREFELAVYEFARTLDPSAEILFNHKVRDRDTGMPRQCDVWINARFGAHWPLSILVSCKDHKRKLHAGDVGTFIDEIRSTGASTGVIYSRGGFSKPALDKAKANGISCCRMYQDEPADIPRSIYFEQFACNPSVQLILKTDPKPPNIATWNDIFDIEDETDNVRQTLLDIIASQYFAAEAKSVDEAKKAGGFPPNWILDLRFEVDAIKGKLWIQVLCQWNRFRARVEAHLLNGSYSLLNESFRGSVTGPSIDTQSSYPGEGWAEITDKRFVPPSNMIISILHLGNVKEALRKELGLKPVG